jgi:hypothetical protein
VAEERRPPEADDAKFQQLKAKASAIAKAMPKEGAAGEAQLLAAAVPNHMLPVQEPQQQRAQYRLEKFLQEQQSKPAR